MLFETPQDTYNAYQKFLKKRQFKKAYRCLEKMLREFPADEELLEDMVDLCVFMWKNSNTGRPWAVKLAKTRSFWIDYVVLGRIEAEMENFKKARECLQLSKKLQKKQPWATDSKRPAKKVFAELEDFIKFREWNVLAKQNIKLLEDVMTSDTEVEFPKESKANIHEKDKKPRKKGHTTDSAKAVPFPKPKPLPSYAIPVKISPYNEDKFKPFIESGKSALNESRMLIDYTHMAVQGGFDELLCLNTISGIEKYWYQIETVKKVLKQFYGRVLLCDEVGLGKTIEAGMLIKEYLMRGMIKNVLILAPAPLVSQWKEEMLSKFGIAFITTDDAEFQTASDSFWKNRFIIASLNTAKSSRNMPAVVEQFYDLVVVDEAHHLRNRRTLSWKLVNLIKKKFIFLLSATPVQNNLIELFNLITLLKPGQFRTERLFKREYVKRGNQKAPANREKLRELLRDVMIRNTRSAIDLKLPNRFASTIRVEPSVEERGIYRAVGDYLRRHEFRKTMINLLLREAGSSPFALKSSLMKSFSSDKGEKEGLRDIVEAIDNLGDISKSRALLEMLMKNPGEKKVVFTQYIKTM